MGLHIVQVFQGHSLLVVFWNFDSKLLDIVNIVGRSKFFSFVHLSPACFQMKYQRYFSYFTLETLTLGPGRKWRLLLCWTLPLLNRGWAIFIVMLACIRIRQKRANNLLSSALPCTLRLSHRSVCFAANLSFSHMHTHTLSPTQTFVSEVGQRAEEMNGGLNRRMERWMDGWINEWTGGWIDAREKKM